MNKIVNRCKDCGVKITQYSIRCRKCAGNKTRNYKIIEAVLKCHDNRFSMSNTGHLLKLTRQRIDQIYKRERGRYWSAEENTRKDKRLLAELEKLIERANSVKFICKNCGKKVLWKDAGKRRKFCTNFCNEQYKNRDQRNNKKLNICVGCGKKFHPYRGSLNAKFHNNKCYFKNMSKRTKIC